MIPEEHGDIFKKYDEGHWIVIPTNGTVKKDGSCVMGRGLALAIKNRHPALAYVLGDKITKYGNHVHILEKYRIVSFPVKDFWWNDAHTVLIADSCIELDLLFKAERLKLEENQFLYMPKVGCGNGKLKWSDVKPILERQLINRANVIRLIYQEEK